MTLAVALVTYRNHSTIEPCLRALLDCDLVTCIRVVDNNSDDGTMDVIQRVASRDSRLRFIANEDNIGFGAGINQAVAHAPPTESLLILNPDCIVTADMLARFVAHLQGAQVLGAELFDSSGRVDPASRRNDLLFWEMLKCRFGRGHYSPYVPRSADKVQSVPAISGAAMLMPRSLFSALHGFDEDFRLHVEDLDFCRRARGIGADVAVCNDVRILHERGVSSRNKPFFVEWNKHLGLLRYFHADEANGLSFTQRALVYAMIWLRLPAMVLKALFRV